MKFSKNPLNQILRFFLEIILVVSFGLLGNAIAGGLLGFFFMFLFPILIMACWWAFVVPGDSSRSGEVIVKTSGIVRLGMELSLFSIASVGLIIVGHEKTAIILLVLTSIHYFTSVDRIAWLLKQNNS